MYALLRGLVIAGALGLTAAPAGPDVLSEPEALALFGRVIDGTGAEPIELGMVVIEGERIACVGEAGDCTVPHGARVIDVGEGTIMPGLIDLHVHSRPHYVQWFLAAGVTTIRDANNAFDAVDAVLAVEPRPRVVFTGPMLDGERTVMRFFGDEGVRRPDGIANAFTVEVTTPEEARAAVDSLAARGAAWVKLYEQLDPEVYAAAAEGARERGLRVMTDLGMHGTRGLSGAEVDAMGAVGSGAHTIEHASGYALAYQRMGGDPMELPYDEALIDSFARATVEAGTAVVPTLSVLYAFADDVTDVAGLPAADRVEGDMLAFFQGGADRRTETTRRNSYLGYVMAAAIANRVRELGGVVGAGSDSPAGVFNVPGGGLHRELELLVREGFSPLEALHAATGAAGRILGRDDLGVLQPGAIADLVVVEGSPAEDITATRAIRHVVLGGRVLSELP